MFMHFGMIELVCLYIESTMFFMIGLFLVNVSANVTPLSLLPFVNFDLAYMRIPLVRSRLVHCACYRNWDFSRLAL